MNPTDAELHERYNKALEKLRKIESPVNKGKPQFLDAFVTSTGGLKIYCADGRELRFPEFTCGQPNMAAHYAGCLIAFADLGEGSKLDALMPVSYSVRAIRIGEEVYVRAEQRHQTRERDEEERTE